MTQNLDATHAAGYAMENGKADDGKMDVSTGKNRLQEYLAFAGILTCNVNPYLPSLSDIGCTWRDLTELMDEQGLFYCKAYRGRTTFLSNEVYFLMKEIRKEKALNEDCVKLMEILRNLEPAESEKIREVSMMERAGFSKAIDTLLANQQITALKSVRVLNPNWSAFLYGTAEAWERHVKRPALPGEPAKELERILLRTMPEDEYRRFAGNS